MRCCCNYDVSLYNGHVIFDVIWSVSQFVMQRNPRLHWCLTHFGLLSIGGTQGRLVGIGVICRVGGLRWNTEADGHYAKPYCTIPHCPKFAVEHVDLPPARPIPSMAVSLVPSPPQGVEACGGVKREVGTGRYPAAPRALRNPAQWDGGRVRPQPRLSAS